MSRQIDGTLGLDRALTGFSGFFGTLATVLVSVGLYGIMAYAVARRTGEIGIRIAIGARKMDILRPIGGESVLLVLFGALVGVPAAIGTGTFITASLLGVSPLDPWALFAAAGAMFAAEAAAAYFPARSPTRVNPMIALRTS